MISWFSHMVCRAAIVAGFLSLAVSTAGIAAEATAQPDEVITLGDCLVVGGVGQSGRAVVHTDAVEALIVAGHWTAPQVGDIVTLPDRTTRRWEAARPGKDGWLSHRALEGGYGYWVVEIPDERVMVLEAQGHGVVYVNGVPRAGDPYQTGWLGLPVVLKKGVNELLFACSRGRLLARLTAPTAPVLLDPRDPTLPDLIIGESGSLWGAIVVANATPAWLDGLVLRATLPGADPIATDVPPLPPQGVRKVAFRFQPAVGDECEISEVPLAVELGESRASGRGIAGKLALPLGVRRADEPHKRTFLSEIDGSVQYYAVVPPKVSGGTADDQPALILSLHGAAVEATSQAAAYSPKSWGYIVAPTNRRPYGFDWEEIGRRDAQEVLALAQERFRTDPLRTYLTGHSMGGHGTWQVGVHYPDRFAAIAPSAGWISFWSYAGGARYENATPVERMLLRASSPSDTLVLSRNYLHQGIYILHGDADDNVPVGQARTMRKHLAEYHADFAYFEQPGAGHWWGNACVDWPPLFDFLRHHVKTPTHAVRQVEFITSSPGVSARCDWAVIEAQIKPMQPSKLGIRLDTATRRFSGTTDNVARLCLDLAELSKPQSREEKGEPVDATPLPAGKALSVELDGQLVEDIPWPSGEQRIWLGREKDEWSVTTAPSAALKGPERYGPFKEVFCNRFLFVVGTGGSEEEAAWALAKARYDAETFQYRGNGSVDVVRDVDFDPANEPDRNAVLYGNADTNGAWAALLKNSPVGVRRGVVAAGQRELKGENLACLFVRPRPGSDRALVGVISGTGLAGMRLTDRLPNFLSGVAYPDCLVLSTDVLSKGTGGILAAGFFDNDWSLKNDDFAWAEPESSPGIQPANR